MALAVFAAVMTVAEAFALQAAIRDTRRWLAGDQARDLRHATAVVTRVVKDNLLAREPGIRVVHWDALPASEWDAVLTGMGTELPKVRQARRLYVKAIKIEI